MRKLRVVIVTLGLVATGITPARNPLQYHGPASRIRMVTNLGWRAQLPIPDPYVQVIEGHVSQMHARGYFTRLASKDLFHGHLVYIKGAPSEFSGTSPLMEATSLFIYHTAEFAERWAREGHLPYEKRNPRSLVGFWDGSVMPLADFIGRERAEREPWYRSNGTLTDSELRDAYPYWFDDFLAAKIVQLGPRVGCGVEPQFLLLPDPWGRLHLGDESYDAFLVCTLDPRELGLNGYDAEPRNFVLDGGP